MLVEHAGTASGSASAELARRGGAEPALLAGARRAAAFSGRHGSYV